MTGAIRTTNAIDVFDHVLPHRQQWCQFSWQPLDRLAAERLESMIRALKRGLIFR